MKRRYGVKPKAPPRPKLVLRLYIVGDAPHSVLAVTHLEALRAKHFPENTRVEIVDIMDDPRRFLADRILATPTLVKVSPPPTRRIIGDLSDEKAVLNALGLTLAESGGAAPTAPRP